MSVGLLFIFVPLILGGILSFIRLNPRLVRYSSILILLLLSAIAWSLPFDEPIRWGIPGVPAFRLLSITRIGSFQLEYTLSSRIWIAWIFSGLCALSIAAAFSHSAPRVIPLILIQGSILGFLAGISDPPLITLCLILLTTTYLLLLNTPRKTNQSSVWRFATHQLIGISIVFIALLIPSAGEESASAPLQANVTIFILGLMVLLGIFPFHAWLPKLFEGNHPFVTALVSFTNMATITVIVAFFLSENLYQTLEPLHQNILTTLGGITVFWGGIFALGSRTTRKTLGYGFMSMSGMTVIALASSFQFQPLDFDPKTIIHILSAQGLSMGLWALSLSILEAHKSHKPEHKIVNEGDNLWFQLPRILGVLSASGFPLLACFPIYLVIWMSVSQYSNPLLYITLAGNIFLLISGVKIVQADSTILEKIIPLSRAEKICLLAGILCIFLAGLIPAWTIQSWSQLLYIGNGIP